MPTIQLRRLLMLLFLLLIYSHNLHAYILYAVYVCTCMRIYCFCEFFVPMPTRVGQYTDFLGIPQYHFDTDYKFLNTENTVFRHYLMYLCNLLCFRYLLDYYHCY